jgi:predicted metal-dependent HD superfamily phosphohydrolase
MFKTSFTEVLEKFIADDSIIERLWKDLTDKYSSSRYYHTIDHLDHLDRELKNVQQHIQHWDIVVLAIAYHDIIYNVLKNDNEEKSARYAFKVLSEFISIEKLQQLHETILATKAHSSSSNPDTNYFTDADLSILGSNHEEYTNYTKQIRKEYQLFPDIIYKPGRQKVIKHFLAMDKIFKTGYFFNIYEMQARENLKQELVMLTKNNEV